MSTRTARTVRATDGRPSARQMTADALLVMALFATFPASILVYIGAGQHAAIATLLGAGALMAAGWVIGR